MPFIVVVASVVFLAISVILARQYQLLQGPWSMIHVSRTFKPMLASSRFALGASKTKRLPDLEYYQFPPLQERTSSMKDLGLKRLDESNWLTLDSNYLPENSLRKQFLAQNRSQVIECLPGSELACHEVLENVSNFLSARYARHFKKFTSDSGPMIYNNLTKESFPVGQNAQNPLEIAAKLAMEDFNVLIKHPATGDYHLQASATLFPAGWRLQERIGTSLANLHAPVPGWQENIGANVNRYFDHLSPKIPMERSNLFIQTTPDLFQDVPELARSNTTVSQLMIRRERQTFTRLRRSGAVLFTVRTVMIPMTDLAREELKALRSQVCRWDESIKVYKGWRNWGAALMEWCDERLGPILEGEEVKKAKIPFKSRCMHSC